MSTDQEVFDAVLAGREPEQAAVTPEVEPQTEPTVEATQPRDESGRFAAAAEEPKTEEPAPEAGKPEPAIPPGRLREEAEARRRAEAEASELRAQMKMLMERMPVPQGQPKPEQPVPDIYEAPDQWADHRIRSTVDPVMQQMHSVLMHNAELVASSILGADKVAAAKEWFAEATRTGALSVEEAGRINSSPNPFEAGVKAHQRHLAMSAVGEDINAYNQKIIAEYVASQNKAATPAQAQPQGGGTIVKLPSNLTRVTSAAPSAPGSEPPVGDGELFEQLTSHRR